MELEILRLLAIKLTPTIMSISLLSEFLSYRERRKKL